MFTNNIASYYGGAIDGGLTTEISISGYCLFLNNSCIWWVHKCRTDKCNFK